VMNLVLSVSTAAAQTVLCGVDLETSMPCGEGDANAIGILDLEVDGVPYDVEFKFDFAADIFTIPLAFPIDAQALAATSAVSDALNTQSLVTTVGPEMSDFYGIPFEFEPQAGWSVRSADYFLIAGGWQPDVGNPSFLPSGAPSSFAVFTAVASPPTCEDDLEQAESELEQAESELDQCLESLAADDSDGDGVEGGADFCPQTPPDAAVNDEGCARDEFCKAIDTNTPPGLRRCIKAKWADRDNGIVSILGTCRVRYVGWNRLCRAIR
jgi:hypothetical protein